MDRTILRLSLEDGEMAHEKTQYDEFSTRSAVDFEKEDHENHRNGFAFYLDLKSAYTYLPVVPNNCVFGMIQCSQSNWESST